MTTLSLRQQAAEAASELREKGLRGLLDTDIADAAALITELAGALPEWRPISEDGIVAEAIFDVLTKYWDAGLDQFLVQRFSNCIQHEGRVFWANPFGHNGERVDLVAAGCRPTHFMPLPLPPVPLTEKEKR